MRITNLRERMGELKIWRPTNHISKRVKSIVNNEIKIFQKCNYGDPFGDADVGVGAMLDNIGSVAKLGSSAAARLIKVSTYRTIFTERAN